MLYRKIVRRNFLKNASKNKCILFKKLSKFDNRSHIELFQKKHCEQRLLRFFVFTSSLSPQNKETEPGHPKKTFGMRCYIEKRRDGTLLRTLSRTNVCCLKNYQSSITDRKLKLKKKTL